MHGHISTLRRKAQDALEASELQDRPLCKEMVDYVIHGGQRPSGELSAFDYVLVLQAISLGVGEVQSDASNFALDDETVQRLERINPS